ncbi:hypothetical protein V8G69_12685 [Gaetbulibacter sp. M235]|uniref:hypothetical protein n=1 Tax=Gaetbulibacter sp. M235 TaxID=3126510 RepID=UPI00374F4C51
MSKSKIMVGLVLLVYISFVAFQFNSSNYFAASLDAILLPLITLTYFINNPKPELFFSLFLICYSIADLIGLSAKFDNDFIPYSYYYYIGNGVYIVAYLVLLVKILRSLSFLHIIKNFKLHIIVLMGLNVYIAYVLQVIVNPYVEMTNEYFVEIIYNVSMLLVLSSSLLAYFYKDDRKSLFMFLGSLAIVFSEVIGVAYMYVDQQNLLNFISTSLTLLAFYFYCQQSSFNNEEINQFHQINN